MNPIQYTVKPGDNLSKIGANYGLDYSQVINPNIISGYRSGNPNLIFPGEVLNINVPGQQAQPQAQPAPQPTAAPAQPAPQPTAAPTTGGLNLESYYTTAMASPEITGLQAQSDALQTQIDERGKKYEEAKATINENPLYAEATRTGRLRRLEEQYQGDVKNILNQKAQIDNKINSAKADVTTKLNLKLQQHQLDQQDMTLAYNQFNTLLSAGALDSASPTDLAALAQQLGLPVSMIQSAVNLSKKKNTQTQLVQSVDDNGNMTVSLLKIDENGNMTVASKQSLGKIGQSAPKSSGNVSQFEYITNQKALAAEGLDALKGKDNHVSESTYVNIRNQWQAAGLDAAEFDATYAGYVNPNYYQSYQLVNPTVIAMFKGYNSKI